MDTHPLYIPLIEPMMLAKVLHDANSYTLFSSNLMRFLYPCKNHVVYLIIRVSKVSSSCKLPKPSQGPSVVAYSRMFGILQVWDGIHVNIDPLRSRRVTIILFKQNRESLYQRSGRHRIVTDPREVCPKMSFRTSVAACTVQSLSKWFTQDTMFNITNLTVLESILEKIIGFSHLAPPLRRNVLVLTINVATDRKYIYMFPILHLRSSSVYTTTREAYFMQRLNCYMSISLLCKH